MRTTIRQPKYKVFYSNDLVSEKDKRKRIAYLSAFVENGEKAESLQELVGAFIDLVEDNLLRDLRKPDADTKALHMYYLVASNFVGFINEIATTGKLKANTIERLSLEIKGGNN